MGKYTKIIITIVFGLLTLYSCKKENYSKKPSSMIVGTWLTESIKVTYYDAITGSVKSQPDTDVEQDAFVNFSADGNYLTEGGEKGTYIYNAESKALTLSSSAGEVQDAQVTLLNDHHLTIEATLISENTKIIVIQSYTK